MASKVFNEFKRASASAEIDLGADDIRVALLMNTTTVDTENDGIGFVGDIGTLGETAGTNYSRKALTGEVVTKDDGNDRAEFDADDVLWTALGNGAAPLQGVLIYKHVTNDADSPVIAWIEFASEMDPGGSNFTINWDAEGVLQFA